MCCDPCSHSDKENLTKYMSETYFEKIKTYSEYFDNDFLRKQKEIYEN